MDIRKSLAITLSLVAAMATAQQTTWREHAAASFAGGSGTAEDPYLIETPEQLAKVAADSYGEAATLASSMANYDVYEAYDGVYFRLEADIDLAAHTWVSICGWSNAHQVGEGVFFDEYRFMGVFDGNGKSISNMNCLNGLFGQTGLFGEIRNVTIKSGTVTTEDMTTTAGAIVGTNRGLIEDCKNFANVSAMYAYPGGIVGTNVRGEDGSLSAVIRRCVNFGTVSSKEGFANGMYSAGICGSSSSVVEQCANYGTVTAVQGAGGVVGCVDLGTVKNCYNRGKVTASSEQTGGVIIAIPGRSGQVEIHSCYNTGLVSSPNGESSLINLVSQMGGGKTVVSNMYNDSVACPGLPLIKDMSMTAFLEIDDATVLDMTSAEMKTQAFAETLNAAGETDAWTVDEAVNDGYPTFTWLVDYLKETGLAVDETVADALDGLTVYAVDGGLVIDGIDDAAVAVYDMAGTLVARGSKAVVEGMSFDRGIYVVSVNSGKVARNVKVAL